MPGEIGLNQLEYSVITDDRYRLEVSQMVQDADGFIWMGTPGAFLRFDGRDFTEPFPQLNAYPTVFTVLLGPGRRMDDAWLGHTRSGVTHVVNGKLIHFEGNGLPTGSVFGLLRDHDGVVWVATTTGVVRFLQGRWTAFPPSYAYTKQHPEGMEQNDHGDVILQDADRGILILRRGAAAFTRGTVEDFVRASAKFPDTAQWERSGPSDDAPLYYDRHGFLWHAEDAALDRWHWSAGKPMGLPDVRESFDRGKGSSSTLSFSLLEDAEQDIWVSTTKGMERFRRPHVTPVPVPVDYAMVAAAPDGSVWIASALNPVYRRSPDGTVVPVPGLPNGVTGLYAAPDGTVWFAGMSGLHMWRHGNVTRVALPEELERAGSLLRSMAMDAKGDLWLTATTFGLYRYSGGSWLRMNGLNGLDNETPLAVAALPSGDLWITYSGQRGVRLSTDGVHRIALASPPLGELIGPVAQDGEGLWLGATNGLIWVYRGKAYPVLVHGPGVIRGIDGLAVTGEHDLWLMTGAGLVRIVASELKAFFAHPDRPIRVINYDSGEPATLVGAAERSINSVAIDRAGTVWRASAATVGAIDPRSAMLNTVSPKPVIVSLQADNKVIGAAGALRLPPLTRMVQITYTAPMFRHPDHGRFEYQLNGVDDAWQDAGNRRSAFYTNLPPGDYRFHVRAYNEDGIGGAAEAVVAFTVAAAWYQTYAFKILCGVTFLGLIAFAWRWHLTRVRERLLIRVDERERIARDLHDTLLQGIQGLILRFHAIRQVSEKPETRQLFDEALMRADQALAEGRDKVSALRSTVDTSMDLAEALINVGDELRQDRAVDFRLTVHGRPVRLDIECSDEVYRIARESVINAFQHGKAMRIDIDIEYGRRVFQIMVRDDGIGFDEISAVRLGHWGLTGMRERAERIRAEFEVKSHPNGGTVVTLAVPAQRAYRRLIP
jgi:signal transduction histidine kinase/ligand-binding sensor domain-containing protein